MIQLHILQVFYFNNNLVDALITPYNTINYDLMLLSIRLPSTTSTTILSLLYKPIIFNLIIIESKSFSTRRAIQLLNTQTFDIRNINIPICNPNPPLYTVTQASTFSIVYNYWSCLLIKSPFIPSLSEYYFNYPFYQSSKKKLII